MAYNDFLSKLATTAGAAVQEVKDAAASAATAAGDAAKAAGDAAKAAADAVKK
jgi:hypothetical protein